MVCILMYIIIEPIYFNNALQKLIYKITQHKIQQNKTNTLYQMQDDLIMNKLPLPQYYDGLQWNTVVRPTRKSIPKYLHEDLPQLKHIYIKQIFKEIGKFNCPKLDYFSTMIKNKKAPRSLSKKTPNTTTSSSKGKFRNKKISTYSQIKQQLQYALIMADKDSNVVDQLLQKAKTVAQNNEKLGGGGTHQIRNRKRGVSQARETGKYFSNTVDLVFRNRKKQYLNSLKQEPELDTTEVEERIKSIKLIDFQG